MDYECPPCKIFEKDKLPGLEKGKNLNIIWKNLPLSMHEFAFKAAVAAEIAKKNGRFKEVHRDLIYCDKMNENKIIDILKNNGVIIDGSFLTRDKDSVRKVNEDMGIASRLNLQGTPSFVLCKVDKTVWLLPKVMDQLDYVLGK